MIKLIYCMKIDSIKLQALENDTHFSFHEAGTTLFSAIECENETFKSKLSAWLTATQHEDQVLKLLQKSLELKTVVKHNDIRRECLSAIFQIVKMHAQCPHSPHQAIAETAYEYLQNSRVKTHSGKDRLTSAIHHILDDLNQEEFQTLLTSIGLKEVFEKMKASNEAVKKAQLARDKENAKKGAGTVTTARQETDKAYRAFVSFANSLLEVFPGMIDEAVSEWNATVIRYRRNLEFKQSLAAIARKKAEAQGNQPAAPQEDNKPSGEQKPSGQTGGSSAGQQPPKPADKPTGDTDASTDSTGSGTGSTGDKTPADGSDSDASQSGNSGSGPIYTPVSPADEVSANGKEKAAE